MIFSKFDENYSTVEPVNSFAVVQVNSSYEDVSLLKVCRTRFARKHYLHIVLSVL